MDASLSNHISPQYVDGELQFDLPVRPLGALRWIGVALIAFGFLFTWSPAHELVGSIREIRETGGSDLSRIAFAVFECLFVLAGLVPVAVGAWFIAGRCRIGWAPGQLRTTEILGPLHWTRRMPRAPVQRFTVGAASSRNTGAAAPTEFDGFAALMVEFASGAKKLLALGYPKAMLMQLAEQLRSYVGGGPVAIVKPNEFEDAEDASLEQPTGSEIGVEEHGDELRLRVPAAGVRRGSSGLFGFAILWCLFITVITAGFVYAQVSGHDDLPWYVWVIMAGFWAVGLMLFLVAINMGRRTAVITASRTQLAIETRGLFGSRRREWARGEVDALRVGASGMEVNDKPVLELQIYPRSGKKVGLLSGRAVDELRWMAARLRATLGVERYA